MSAEPGRRALARVRRGDRRRRGRAAGLVAVQPGLWADEIFSLAMATGHSLEHPAAIADPPAATSSSRATPSRRPASAVTSCTSTPPAGIRRVLRAVRSPTRARRSTISRSTCWLRAFGTSDAALLRFLSTVCALPRSRSSGRWLRVLGGRRVALLATLLFALAPPALYYSAEGRMYALTWLLGLALARVTLVLARDGARRRRRCSRGSGSRRAAS